ncbi:hypothetical protein FSBG_00399 [Fusobacterium gonidiaformans 3-1-5R]|uniref:Uncharacterized protein n=1 Tax=Fusobacterium gonidiaformans 3-1-5R TaxID=469605 RepID=E5BFM1_9FUSO|nr:hypothetical protein [Fusobacterium gonidiaformans]EFS20902.1 hypothetical protein FSBG_00399 [Fusobacterium gonidiaformans 3-1-5R]
MKQVITFRSFTEFFEKEKSGLKCNTVRLFTLSDDREYILQDIMNEDIIQPYASEIRFIRGRLKFGNSKNSAPFPSMIVVFREGVNKTK